MSATVPLPHLTGEDCRLAASAIGLAIHANGLLCDLARNGVDVQPEPLPVETTAALLDLQSRLFQAGGDAEGVAASLLSRIAYIPTTDSQTRDPNPTEPPSGAASELSRAQELAVDRVGSEWGRCAVRPLADGSVEICALLDDIEMYTVCIERDGSERWRR